LDVQSGVNETKCVYCGTTSRVQALRTLAFQTPPGWRAPEQWVPPAHAAASSAVALSYQAAANTARGIIVAVSLIVPLVIAIGVGVAIFAFTRSEQALSNVTSSVLTQAGTLQSEQASGAISSAMAEMNRALAVARNAGAAAPSAAASPLTSAGVVQALAAYKGALGTSTLSLMELTLHDSHSSVEAQSATNGQHVDRYNYRAGSVTGPEPVRLAGRDKANLKGALFNPEKTALLSLDELKIATLKELKYEAATVSHVIMRRDRGKTEILVYGSDQRDSGYVRFDEQGKVVRVYR
jgi:hypothetical protein